ncbi:MAG: hypothetical protein Q4D93_02225 [Porphyromonas sp.]|nr:hypothetical protein [Porphyromonas sp.]
MGNIDEKDAWGDDELTALDVSPAFLLERADWSNFYNEKGYTGSYPFLLYMHEDAEVLDERLLAEVNRTQSLEGKNKLQLDLFTRFIDREGEVHGAAWLLVSGMRSIAPDLKEDLVRLFRMGAKAWIEESYESHGAVAVVHWMEESEEQEAWMRDFEDKRPPLSNMQYADFISTARITADK